MTAFPAVDHPEPVDGTAASLGRLEPALQWLASTQGCWPPRPPRARRVVVASPGPGSLESGAARADAAADSGVDLLVVGAAGDAAPGLVLAAALGRLEPVAAVGTAGGPGWAQLVVDVRDGLRAARPHLSDPPELLRVVGDGAVAELAGLLARAAARRTAVVLDDSPLVAGAALVASRLAAGAEQWWLLAQEPTSPAVTAAMRTLGRSGLLDLDVAAPHAVELAETVLRFGVDVLARAAAE